MPALDAAGVTDFIESVWPGALTSFVVEHVDGRGARVRLRHHDGMLRPGATVAGPALMSLADTAMWAAVLGAVGPVAMTADGAREPCARASVTYSIPPEAEVAAP